jgi:hypothetical protein
MSPSLRTCDGYALNYPAGILLSGISLRGCPLGSTFYDLCPATRWAAFGQPVDFTGVQDRGRSSCLHGTWKRPNIRSHRVIGATRGLAASCSLQYVMYRTLLSASDIVFAHHGGTDGLQVNYNRPSKGCRFKVPSREEESLPQNCQKGCQRLTVPKRNLRVLKWQGQVPAIGVCTLCNRIFKVPPTAMKRVADAQESLRIQFTEHKCKGDEASPT